MLLRALSVVVTTAALKSRLGNTATLNQDAVDIAVGDTNSYQAFLDFHPVSRFNNFKAFSRDTIEGGRHKFPAYEPTRLPALLDRADWTLIGSPFDHFRKQDPDTVFMIADPGFVQNLLAGLSKISSARNNRTLVMGDSDLWLSAVLGGIPASNPFDADYAISWKLLSVNASHVNAYKKAREAAMPTIEGVVAELRKYFSRIFFEAKDVNVDGVRTMPIGYTEFFLRNGVAETAKKAMESASIDRKEGWVKGAFSFYHDLARCPRGWGEAQELRIQARSWSKSAVALAAGVNSAQVEPLDWWGTIAKYRFLMAPAGCGVQTPKQTEALAVLTVPIARRGPYPVYDDLVSYGFPIVVVDEWDEVNQANLTKWWAAFSPRLVSFRKNCLNADGYWRLFTGQTEYCE